MLTNQTAKQYTQEALTAQGMEGFKIIGTAATPHHIDAVDVPRHSLRRLQITANAVILIHAPLTLIFKVNSVNHNKARSLGESGPAGYPIK